MSLIDLAKTFIDFVLHVDRYLGGFITQYGAGIYVILFLIVFIETGLVFMPFLPGDSLIFIAGTLAGAELLNVWILFGVFFFAATAGDNMNYWLGHHFGKRVFEKSRFFNKKYLVQTEEFFAKHGKKTIFLARFVPIIRTFSPFVAGVGRMNYKQFVIYDLLGTLAWVSIFLTAGYFFGGIPMIKENLVIVTFIIIFISFIPVIVEYIKHRRRKYVEKKNLDLHKLVNK
jgi:membrane-associated protein